MLDELKSKNKLVGFKQSQKALASGLARKIFLAREAEDKIRLPLEEACARNGIELEYAETLKELGEACGLKIGVAAAALLNLI